MGRYQSDHIYEASGAFFVRYYVSAIVDGKATRVQRSYRVCSKDDKYHSRTCKAVKQKAAEQWTPRMRRCSGQRPDHCSLLGKDVPALRGGESPSRDRSRLQTNLGPASEHALRHDSVEGLQDAHGESVPHVPCEETRSGDDSANPISCVRHLRPRSQRRRHRVQPVARCQSAREDQGTRRDGSLHASRG